MTEYTGDDRRKGNRRKVTKWILFWPLLVVGSAIASGSLVYAMEKEPEPEPIVITDNTQGLLDIQGVVLNNQRQLELLSARQPEVRTVITTEIIRDTLPVPYPVPSPPEIVHTVDSFPVFVYDTTWMPPQIVRIPASPRSFAEYGLVGLGGGIVGYIVRSIFESSAKACVVINGEETCSYNGR